MLDEPPEGDVVEMDELCIRFSPALWLWVAVSRTTRLVLGFVVSDRTDTALQRLLDEALHPAWREVPVCTDGWGAYQRLLPAQQHTVCDKGSGQTSVAEALNTTWRQRQSGLAHRACGVCWRIVDDLTQRFLLLTDQHNRQCLQHWHAAAAAAQAGRQSNTRSSP